MTNQEVEVPTGQKLFLHLKEIIWLVLRKIGTLSDATRWLVNLEQCSNVIQPSLITTSGHWDNPSFGPSTRNVGVVFHEKLYQSQNLAAFLKNWEISIETNPFVNFTFFNSCCFSNSFDPHKNLVTLLFLVGAINETFLMSTKL